MTDALDRLVGEARDDLGVREARQFEWDAVNEGLFARIEQERRAERARFLPGRGGAWAVAAAVLVSAAAAITVVVGNGSVRAPVAGVGPRPSEALGAVGAIEGIGQVLIGGSAVAQGAPIRLGDVIEARGADVVIERAGKVKVVVESGSRLQVTHGQGTFVMALERGAVEADVVPVARGEAFAVDVGSSRIAVHGTHLRVTRSGPMVAVDLSEGVVSIGAAPRVGQVMGTLVTAPAHVEFADSDAVGTLTVTHDPTAVRTPIEIGAASEEIAAPKLTTASADLAHASKTGGAIPHPAVLVPPPRSSEPHANSASPPHPAVTSEQAVANAVRSCMAERPHAENVTVLVSTTLHLDVGEDGAVRTARFDPPVVPDVNECAAPAIYRERFEHPGALAIPIDFKN